MKRLESYSLIRLKEILQVLPVSKSTWYRGIDAGIYPRPLKLGARTVAWYEHEIIELLENMPRV